MYFHLRCSKAMRHVHFNYDNYWLTYTNVWLISNYFIIDHFFLLLLLVMFFHSSFIYVHSSSAAHLLFQLIQFDRKKTTEPKCKWINMYGAARVHDKERKMKWRNENNQVTYRYRLLVSYMANQFFFPPFGS